MGAYGRSVREYPNIKPRRRVQRVQPSTAREQSEATMRIGTGSLIALWSLAAAGLKEYTISYAKNFLRVLLMAFFVGSCALAQDPGWPRKQTNPGATLFAYQPQVDNWNNFHDITWRQAFQLTPTGGKQVLCAATFEGTTSVNNDTHMVTIYGIQVLNTYFPDLDPAISATMDKLLRTFMPPVITIALERVVSYLPKPHDVQTVNLNNTPPLIFVNYSPAILLDIDGQAVFSDVQGADLRYVVNTSWPLFQFKRNQYYYLLVNNIWLSSGELTGPWARVTDLPKEFSKLPNSGMFVDVRKMIPPPQVANPIIPAVLYSTAPAEVILFDGQPTYTAIAGTQLSYANNTNSPVFLYNPTQTYYYLAAGRWFSASSLNGPWAFASLNLPGDFSNIPMSSPASAILASVPGTPQAKDAVLIAQIPTTMVLNPTTAAAQARVTYTGAPQFAPIEGTTLQYATNTPDKVIQVGDVYYLCLQGVWFISTTPQGPWTTASSVPQVIYTIPPSSPVYNVTYVTQTTTLDGNIQASYTAGYLGAFVMGAAVGAIVCSGTGYYYPPYIGYPAYGYPVYHPYATPYGYGAYGTPYYNTRTGAYGVSSTTYGAYGSTTRAASYNPYTGTYKQGTSVSTPYGRQSAGQAYNPYTGTYGATHQGSSPTAQWGQSYVQRGNQAAYTQHYSTENGTVASAQGSQGGKAYASSTPFGSTYAGKNASGDMYAGHDGNVYQNTGSGWQKYNNSANSWQNVNTQQAQQQAQQDRSNYQQQHPDSQANMQQHEQSFNQERSSGGWNSQGLDQDRENRWNGASSADRWQEGQHSEGGWGGGGRSWGGGGWRR